MQFAYQFPDRVDRLILISSGGLWPHVTPMLRAAIRPGPRHAFIHTARTVIDWQARP
jgi:pimeloyl-ACP methyl ester carboxylesterase